MRIEKKVKNKYFEAVADGRKRFEVRLADFECSPGDLLVLKEQDEKTNNLTGRELECELLYKFNTKDLERFYSKEDIEKQGLIVLAIRKSYKHKKE